MKRRPRPGTRHRRLQKNLRNPARQSRWLRNRANRHFRRELITGMRLMFEKDDRLVPPTWLRDEVLAMNVHRPGDLIKLTVVP